MFDLEKAVRAWVRELRSNPSLEEASITELEESLRDDVQGLVESGLSEEQAFRQVTAEMGRPEDIGAEFHRASASGRSSGWARRFMPALARDYIRVAVRKFESQKFGSLINLTGLAAVLAVCILISLWVRDELSYDKFLVNRDRLYLLTIEHPNGILDPNVPYALAPALTRDYPEIQLFTRIYDLGALATCSFSYQPENGPKVMAYEDSVNLVDPGFFSMFSFPFVSGDPATALGSPNAVVIRDEAARRYFGDGDPVGRRLTFNNRRDLVVTGVMHIARNAHIRPDFVIPLSDPLSGDWNWRDPSYILLDPSASLPSFREKIEGSLKTYMPQPLPGTFKVGLLPVTKVHLGFGGLTYVNVFSLIAVIILAIACVNYINLATARAGSRSREVGLRKVMGAGRTQLVQQFIGEALVTTALAFVLALGLVVLLLPFLNRLTGKALSLSSGIDPLFAAYLLGLVVLVGVAAGSYPAFFLSARRPVEAFRTVAGFRSKRSAFRVVSVVGQFAISAMLIACTLSVFRQLQFVRNRPLGLVADQVLKVRYNPSLLRHFESFKQDLLQNPRVLNVTRSQAVPFDEDYKTGGVEWDGKDPALMPLVRYSLMDVDLFETFGMEFAAGRGFSAAEAGDRLNYVINEKAAAYMGLNEPVGARLKLWGQEGRIIGVVKDFHHVSLHREILPQVFTINPRFTANAIRFIFIKVVPAGLAPTLRAVRDTAAKYAPDYPFEAAFLDKGAASLYGSEKRLGSIFTAFALLAVIISCLGILGLAAYSVEQRTKEIGVRKVLGSTVPAIVARISRPFWFWILAANLLAWPFAYFAMRKWLRAFAYRTDLDFGLFVMAGLLTGIAAALPVVYQSLKAALADPIKALRYE